MDQKICDKVVYWQQRQAEAMQKLSHLLSPYYVGYFGKSYVVAWQEQQRMAYQQIVRHRGF